MLDLFWKIIVVWIVAAAVLGPSILRLVAANGKDADE